MAKTATTKTPRAAWKLADAQLITAAELAAWLQVPVKSIYRGEQDLQTLPCVRLGRQCRWRVGAVRKWIGERERTARPAPQPHAEPEAPPKVLRFHSKERRKLDAERKALRAELERIREKRGLKLPR